MRNLTGILVLIESADYKNAIEMDKQDYINDGVMMILIAVQVIFEEQQHQNFAMNVCFGLAQCDHDNHEMWKNLENQKIGVIDAIHQDLEENGIHIEKGQIPLFYLSSKEVPGSQEISQKKSFLDMMNFFESTRENDEKEIIFYPRADWGDREDQIDSLVQRLSIMGGTGKRFSFVDNLGKHTDTLKKKILEKSGKNPYFKLIMDAEEKIQKMKENLALKVSQGENLKLIFSEEQDSDLGFWDRMFDKKIDYSGKIKISHIEIQEYKILSGGEGSKSCVFQKPLEIEKNAKAYLKIYGQHKDFKSYQIHLQNSKKTLRQLIKYREKLVEESNKSKTEKAVLRF